MGELLADLHGHLLDGVQSGLALVQSAGKPFESVKSWLTSVLEQVQAEVKDPQVQGRVAEHALKVFCNPHHYGEIVRRDHCNHYKLPGKALKARVGKVRILFGVLDDRSLVLHEIVLRKEAYGLQAVQGRKPPHGR